MSTQSALSRAALVLFAVNILNFYDRNVAGALTEPVRREFHLSDTQIGWLGTGFTLLYALVGVPLGRLADRISRKKLLVGGVLVWSVLTAFAGLASSYGMLMFARLGVAVGEAACAPTAVSWIGDLFPPDRRARALSTFMLGVPLGAALTYFFSGPIAQAFGWRMAMVVAARCLALVPLLLRIPEPRRGASETHSDHDTAADGAVGKLLRIPTLWWIIFSGAFLNFNMYAMGTFLPALFARIHGLSLSQAGIATGIVYAIGGLGGGMLAGRIGDRIIHTRKNGRLLAASVFALLTAPAAFFGILQPAGSLLFAVPLLTVAYAGCNTYYGFVYSSIQDIVPPSLRATTMALYFLAMYLLGASFGPLLTGSLSDWRARVAAQAAGSSTITEQFRAIGLQEAMFIIPVLALALAAVLYAGSKTVQKDIANRDRLLAFKAHA